LIAGERMAAGPHRVALDAAPLPAGLYLVRLRAGDDVVCRRLLSLD
jgi:hypothetical protein